MQQRSIGTSMVLALVFYVLSAAPCSGQSTRAAPTSAPASAPASAPIVEATPAGIVLGTCLAIEPPPRGVRQSMLIDPIEATLVAGTFTAPRDGDQVGPHRWHAIEAKENTYTDRALEGGWAYISVDSPNDRIMLLAAAGQSMTYVNGEPRGGDVYEAGSVRLPINLHTGRNDLLFVCGRGRLRVELIESRAKLFIDTADATLPDFVRGEADRLPMAALVTNATTQPIALKSDGLPDQVIAPLSARKVRAFVDYDGKAESKIDYTFSANDPARALSATSSFTMNVVDPGGTHKRTFISDIDDSVQYFSVVPPRPSGAASDRLAMILSLHGASVEATSQAGAYSPKSWAYIVCPTNRRPFGFDWEDWGRMDALEVLDRAQALYKTDPTKCYLTGHSMGGHGTWQVGSLYPDRFAAIGASAGWLSFNSYRDPQPASKPATQSTTPATTRASGEPAKPATVSELFSRATNTTDTQTLMQNLAPLGVYILHGTDDDNVPFTQAEQAMKILGSFHHDFRLHAQPKAGHWWDASDEPGTDCVDWAPMFDFFARHRLPENREVREVDFRTFNPSVSSRCDWLAIDAQVHPMLLSHVQMRCDPGAARFVGTTENVARLWLDLRRVPKGDKPILVEIDGVKIELRGHEDVWLYREGEMWKQGDAPTASMKTARRGGPFKLAFLNHMVLVYGTHGSVAENTAGFDKARFDAETWWYRGNGSVEVIPDTDDRWRNAGCNVILYGNADTNGAWNELLNDSPIQVSRGRIKFAGHEETGDDLAAMFIRPRAGSDRSMIVAIAGTGPAGMRLTNRVSIFASGIGMPDWCVFGPQVLKKGMRGALGAGYFANDWTISGENSVIGTTSPSTGPSN